ncbi:hypothetical protein K435DRAFT_371017 [Dendrothele bispora CBS 962.96]|uniref:Uncharacterized protein n=1 Tax=Dendrothele bispora (strain CBS 962.96) TaxID=1314807 RepID=A0A4S8LBX3_DENBC|nr:hypothetical protein K435DRAFT_371017 [Dendrothele bispora CBS 962.96]
MFKLLGHSVCTSIPCILGPAVLPLLAILFPLRQSVNKDPIFYTGPPSTGSWCIVLLVSGLGLFRPGHSSEGGEKDEGNWRLGICTYQNGGPYRTSASLSTTSRMAAKRWFRVA